MFRRRGLPRQATWRSRCARSPRWSGGIRWPTWRRLRSGPLAPVSRRCAWAPAACGASRCGAPGGYGTPRLTSVLVLFFLYLGHVALVRAFDDPQRGYRSGAILALIGVVNLPIIKFSVYWWNTLHQPDTITLTGAPTMYIGMLWPLLVCALGYTFVFAAHGCRSHARRGHGAADPNAADGASRGGASVTHLPYIAASYALGVLIPTWFGVAGFPADENRAATAGRARPSSNADDP